MLLASWNARYIYIYIVRWCRSKSPIPSVTSGREMAAETRARPMVTGYGVSIWPRARTPFRTRLERERRVPILSGCARRRIMRGATTIAARIRFDENRGDCRRPRERTNWRQRHTAVLRNRASYTFEITKLHSKRNVARIRRFYIVHP